MQEALDKWHTEYQGRPLLEYHRLMLLALEREQIVAVAYREEAVAARVAALDVGDKARDLVRQTLIWIWKDEQLHAEYLRGELLRAPSVASSLVVFGRQLQGALSGWTTATSNHSRRRTSPFRAGTAGLLVAAAGLTGRIPRCSDRNSATSPSFGTASSMLPWRPAPSSAYRRLVELCDDADRRNNIDRIREDEARHTSAFRLLADALNEDDRLVNPAALRTWWPRGRISIWFVPSRLRSDGDSASGLSLSGPSAGARALRFPPPGRRRRRAGRPGISGRAGGVP